ncbi:MAG: hypothetical protein DHS20C06_07090 [Hyphobacterium sp.]|nr:MAG: hypothetical protein DHS20C06_07090 [Hyphobacterium sp.]
MSGFGKRGASSNKPGAAAQRPAARTTDRLDQRPAPRIQNGSSLHWGRILPLSGGYATEVPDSSGVYALMSGKRDDDVVFLGGTKDLRSEFLTETKTQKTLAHPHAEYFCFAETPAPYEQADREIQIFRRRLGKKPLLNSGF